MKTVEILVRFKDKYTGEWYEVGDSLVISEERFEEIKSFCKEVESVEIKPKTSKNKKK